MASNKHIGSSFDDFLSEEGIIEEIDARVQKRVFAEAPRAASNEPAISESGLARAMKKRAGRSSGGSSTPKPRRRRS